MRIGLVLPSLKFGGAERVALNLARELTGRGMQVDIVLMQCVGEFLPEARAFATIIDLQCDRTYQLPARSLRYVRQQRPDALLVSFWKLNLCACLLQPLVPKLQLLLWEHSLPSRSRNSPVWLYAPSASLLYRLAARIIAVSDGVQADILAHTLGLEHKLQIIYNPIAPPPPALLARPPGTTRPAHVIWVGRLAAPKNPALMLDAFRLLRAERECRLTVIGTGPLAASLQRQCQETGLADAVTFAGFQPAPYTQLADADLLAVTSDHEGFGNVLVEAMYCGLRVVSTDCGEGVHRITDNGRYGRIVPCNDPQALARAMLAELAAVEDVRQRQQQAAARFAPAQIADQFLAVLAERR